MVISVFALIGLLTVHFSMLVFSLAAIMLGTFAMAKKAKKNSGDNLLVLY